MARDADPRGGGRALLEARCAWCGPVRFEPPGLRVHVGSGADALFEFDCPRCGRSTLGPLVPTDVDVLVAAGAPRHRGRAPFELLERRSGPPIGWDDLIDFHQALARAESPGTPVTTGFRAGAAQAPERDAA